MCMVFSSWLQLRVGPMVSSPARFRYWQNAPLFGSSLAPATCRKRQEFTSDNLIS